MKHLKVLGIFFLLLAMAASAQAASMNHGKGGEAQFNQDYMKAMNDMHEPMMRGVMDKDADAAFVRGMLWHHRGAVDMAKIQLKYGKDPELRKLAQDIIEAQEKEIKFMQEWLKKKGQAK